MLQGAIRNISAFAGLGPRGPTRALPPACGLGPAALQPPPRAPSSHSPALADTGRITGKATARVPRGSGKPGCWGVVAAMHPPCSIQSKNWVAPLGAWGCCGCPTHIWVPRDKGRGGHSRGSGATMGDGLSLGNCGTSGSCALGSGSTQHPGDPLGSCWVMLSMLAGRREGPRERWGLDAPTMSPGEETQPISASPTPKALCALSPLRALSAGHAKRSRPSDLGPRAGVQIPTVCRSVKLTNGWEMW